MPPINPYEPPRLPDDEDTDRRLRQSLLCYLYERGWNSGFWHGLVAGVLLALVFVIAKLQGIIPDLPRWR